MRWQAPQDWQVCREWQAPPSATRPYSPPACACTSQRLRAARRLDGAELAPPSSVHAPTLGWPSGHGRTAPGKRPHLHPSLARAPPGALPCDAAWPAGAAAPAVQGTNSGHAVWAGASEWALLVSEWALLRAGMRRGPPQPNHPSTRQPNQPSTYQILTSPSTTRYGLAPAWRGCSRASTELLWNSAA